MDIEFNNDKTVSISTPEYIDEAIECFGEDLGKSVTSPATKNLFDVNEESKPLSAKKQEIFHSVVARVLLMMKRSRPDLETAISFLCTRVAYSTEEDWEKLRRLLKFLQQTKSDKRVIGAKSLTELNTWIDASYAVHPNMRGHTGGVMSMGHGVIHARAGKQKLNVKSSTEAEIVGLSEYLPYNIYIKNFMEEQGYVLKKNEVKQDNMSAIRMEKNGRNSCTGNSRHVHIRYFFVKDRIDKGELTIEYCPTTEMLADYFTKPLQGGLFKRMRAVIMGWADVDTLQEGYDAHTNKERVENTNDVDSINVFKCDVTNDLKYKTYAEAVNTK